MTRALVLSGGGSVGIAWQSGLAAGLATKGVDLREADYVVGTSAGSAVGAQIALGRDMSASLDRYRTPEATARASSSDGATNAQSTAERMQKLMEVMAKTTTSGGSPEETRAAIGRFALEADTPPEDRFVAGFAYLAGEGWPEGYACTAVDAETGEFKVWDAAAGAPLERAVASSCAVPGLFPPITIDGRRYIDGGMRSGSNADLAAGHDKVLLITLMSPARAAANPADPRLAQAQARIDRELAVLTDAGATLEIVGPDDEAAAAIGGNLMDPRNLAKAADAGLRQGEGIAAGLVDFWG